MADKSSYLQYLPPVLWENEPDDPEFSLGGALRIFEKILTGIPDHVTTDYPPLTAAIAQIPRLFDPWTAPGRPPGHQGPDFLTWLASWVDLEFPTLQGDPVWDDHQQRTVISKIVSTYRQRGQRAGLARYLDLCAMSNIRPRIAVDDGSRVLTVTPGSTGPAPVTALVSQGPVIDPSQAGAAGLLAEGIMYPSCVAVGANGVLFLGDPGDNRVGVTSRVWRISADGRYDMTGSPPRPQPFAAGTLQSRTVKALAVRPATSGQLETLYILDGTGRISRVATSTPGAALTTVAELGVPHASFTPVGMCVDPAGEDPAGDLLVLDNGDGIGTPNPPQIVVVPVATGIPTRRKLQAVVEPQSLLVEPDGSLLIGDGREQETTSPANLVRVDRSVPANWSETVLLPTDTASNPLVAPTALSRGDDGELYVLDAGLKPLNAPDATRFVLSVAEPATVYRVSLPPGGAPSVRAASGPGRLVYPTGMVARAGRLIVCDPGQPFSTGERPRWARLLPFAFEVVVHFTASRIPPEDPARSQVLNQTVLNIETMVDQQKPAHTVWTPVTTS